MKPLILKHAGIWAFLLSTGAASAQTLPPIYANTPYRPVASRILKELPRNTFLENIAIAKDGTAFITSYLDGRVLRMMPGGEVTPWAQVEGKLAGIAVRSDGGLLLSGWTKEEKAALFEVDAKGKARLLTLIEGGMFPNGITAWKDGQFFVADSYRGAIYLVDGKTGQCRVWMEDEKLRRESAENPTPGLNGLKVFGGNLYASNTARQQLLRIAIDRQGQPAGVSVVSSTNNLDDFAIDGAGNIYATTHVYNSVVKVAPDGKTEVIANEAAGMAGSTALAFGRRAEDRDRLYVVTNGGMSLPPAGGVQTAKIVELDLKKKSIQAKKGTGMEHSIETVSVTSKGNRVAALKSGQGPAVVIVHGIGGHKEDWKPVMATLSSQHTVYAIDMIGFGGSSKEASEILIEMQADAVGALLEAEGVTRASIVGNSVGGWVAATFAARHPERVAKLVLVDAAGFKAMFEGPSPVNFYPETVSDMQKLLSFVTYDAQKHTAEFAAKALEGLNQSGDRVAAGAVFKGLFASPRLEELMPKIQAPTLVVWGAQDKLFPPGIADLVSGGIAGSKKVLIGEAGHFPQLDNPAGFQAVVGEFLQP